MQNSKAYRTENYTYLCFPYEKKENMFAYKEKHKHTYMQYINIIFLLVIELNFDNGTG